MTETTRRPSRSPRLRDAANAALRRSSSEGDDRALLSLVVLTLVLAIPGWIYPEYVPVTALVLPLILGSLILGPRHLPWFIVFVLLCIVGTMSQLTDITPRVVGGVVVLFIAGFIILLTSFRRTRLGVAGARGESMLVDLRDRIQSQGTIPTLPVGYHAESALRPAGGTPFAGDFVVIAGPPDNERLEVVMVDVSGKGEGAGTRALLLAGAFGGLLGALPPADFLPAANRYLLQQHWEEGFATAVHLSLDMSSGVYEIRSAGHPPAAHRIASTGRWAVHSGEGPALGLLDDVEFPAVSGQLRPGDAIMLYTDGLVETATMDIAVGIDKMLGQAEVMLRGNFDGGAQRMIDTLGSRSDDRALVLVSRR
ncbi:PP2C family protein-serine/threonine phosphatase [Nocardioides sp. GXQ0305]|uniref:PP2C family protein-serine/threonine phosphatase n=1 Tax=Nocardioides sp. GXQ0305 TaxID=3423912 RepID=UPI003D7CB635